ncbi:MAG: archaetidylserine decarboxylase [Pseudomonadota bacterium]|jgi:phosphatidylserine decarboxylase
MTALLPDSLYVSLQRLLPQHALSRAAGAIADCRWPWLRQLLIRAAIRRYGIDLSEAAETDCRRYSSFNEFFVRPLAPGARPLSGDEGTLIAPADGMLSAAGALRDGQLLQAKGHGFPVAALVGDDGHRVRALAGGSFATIYLSPRDYHRVHAPLAGRLVAADYLPGRLFSVNPRTDRTLPGLYAGNERLVCWFDTAAGGLALVLVGALLVAGIETVWQAGYRPGLRHRRWFAGDDPAFRFRRGAELGRFRFGSTVILLAPPGITWSAVAGRGIQLGEPLGRIEAHQPPAPPASGPAGAALSPSGGSAPEAGPAGPPGAPPPPA